MPWPPGGGAGYLEALFRVFEEGFTTKELANGTHAQGKVLQTTEFGDTVVKMIRQEFADEVGQCRLKNFLFGK